MNKKIVLLISIFMCFITFNINVNAAPSTRIVCNNFTQKNQCLSYNVCNWDNVNKVCRQAFVASEPCEDNNIKTVLRFFGYLLLIAKVAVPLIIIAVGTFDFYKSVIDKDEKSFNKQLKIFLMRLLSGVFVFFIPTVVYAIFNISSSLNIVNEQKYKACVDCLLTPTDVGKCNIK